ncbi:7588_t:CDS:2 [Funneliformis mosseae]|uniref:7588_t:CDS:1 n=1 Tax=Funneliformis mosseae TaxID=27381 RepID=A0A9N9H234_FUNMO|nr:7588_t:CDS:2 [Funneliformis mosseae]
MVLDDTHPGHIIQIPKLNLPSAVAILDDSTESYSPIGRTGISTKCK